MEEEPPETALDRFNVKPFVVNLPLVKVSVPVTEVPALRVNPALLFNVKLFADVTEAPVTWADVPL